MAEILPVNIENEIIYIEAEPTFGSEETSVSSIQQLTSAFDRARETAVKVTGSMVSAIRAMEDALTPDEFALEFGIKFKADGNVVVASVGTEATLNIKMTYRNNKQGSPAPVQK